jgi:hypothetical protein
LPAGHRLPTGGSTVTDNDVTDNDEYNNENTIMTTKDKFSTLIDNLILTIDNKTMNTDNFITINEIEKLLGDAINESKTLITECLQRKLSQFKNETELIHKKKQNTPVKV